MNKYEFVYNVGEVVLGEEVFQSFWIFPKDYIYSTDVYVHSPWFSLLDEKWRLVKKPSDTTLDFYLWKKFHRSRPSWKFDVQLILETTGKNTVGYCDGCTHADYCFETKDFCSLNVLQDQNISCCGLMKLFFIIRKIENPPDNCSTLLAKISVAETSSDDLTSSESGTSSERETSSDDEDKKEKSVVSGDKGVGRLARNLKQAFLDRKMSDAVLKVGSREFGVHKVVLVARSPVFESMFQYDLAEKNTNIVDIPDCTAESFEVFLHYLYSGSVETISTSNVCNLYYAADKYQVGDLKEECVEFMLKNLSLETFCDVIALSLRHGESKLQKAATSFFCKNVKNIIKTVQWQKYIDENSTQANELFIKALNA